MTFASIATNPSGYTPQLIAILIAVTLVEAILKGFALWRSARMEKMWWFVTILIVNSAGVFPLIYLLMTNKQYKAFKASVQPQAPQTMNQQNQF